MQPTESVTMPQNSTIDRLRPVRVPSWLRAGMKVAGAVAPGPAAVLAQRLFFSPPRTPARADELAVLAQGERFALQAGGQRVVGRAWGEGPTVLLVHGWGGHSGQMTSLVEPVVATGFRAVAIDLPGHGESGGRLSSVVHAAAAVEGVAALFRPVQGLIAHSFGAAASTYAMSRGVTVGRAVFFAPPASFESFWTRLQAGLGVSEGMIERMKQETERWLKVRFDGIAPLDLAPAMKTPLLVLHDPGDREMPFDEGEELVRRWPGAVLHRAAGRGHLRILRDETCVEEAVRFLIP